MFLLDVCSALSASRVSFAVVGGYAVALHGAVRGTVDLDLVLAHREANYVRAEAALLSLGLSSRLPVSAKEVFRFRREYLENRNLIAWSFVDTNNPTRLVDIVLTFDGARVPTKRVTVGGVRVPILTKTELIRMKTAAGRPQDREDVQALRRLK